MFIIGIAGGSGSGKTTFAKKVQDHIGKDISTMISMDSYYLNDLPEELQEQTDSPNFDHPHAFNWPLIREHISQLKSGAAIEMPIYDFTTNSQRQETQTISPTKIILFEGIFTLFDKTIREFLDIKCFLDIDSDIRFTRRLHRDVKERGRSLESVIEQYYQTVRPMYQKYLAPQEQFSDFTVGEETDIAAKILSARLKELSHE